MQAPGYLHATGLKVLWLDVLLWDLRLLINAFLFVCYRSIVVSFRFIIVPFRSSIVAFLSIIVPNSGPENRAAGGNVAPGRNA